MYRLAERWNGFGFHLVLLGALCVVALVGYDSTLRFADHRGFTAWDPTSPWDDVVPALPWTILIYLTLYFYFPLPLLVADRTRRGRCEFALFIQGMLLLFGISFGCFLLLPAEIVVRTEMEQLVPSMGPAIASLYGLLYELDRPWNAWPSLHVSESLMLVLFVQRCLTNRATDFPRRKFYLTVVWIGWLTLALSILTTRQHFVWDLVSGTLLGTLLWRVYVVPRFRRCAVAGVS